MEVSPRTHHWWERLSSHIYTGSDTRRRIHTYTHVCKTQHPAHVFISLQSAFWIPSSVLSFVQNGVEKHHVNKPKRLIISHCSLAKCIYAWAAGDDIRIPASGGVAGGKYTNTVVMRIESTSLSALRIDRGIIRYKNPTGSFINQLFRNCGRGDAKQTAAWRSVHLKVRMEHCCTRLQAHLLKAIDDMILSAVATHTLALATFQPGFLVQISRRQYSPFFCGIWPKITADNILNILSCLRREHLFLTQYLYYCLWQHFYRTGI